MRFVALAALIAALSTPTYAFDIDATLKAILHGSGPKVDISSWHSSDAMSKPHTVYYSVSAFVTVECDAQGRCKVVASGHS